MARQDRRLEAAEDELVECMGMLLRMPDRERSWLRGGNAWPSIVRERWEDLDKFFDAPPPVQSLSRREMARVERMFLLPGCHVERVPAKDRRLVAVVAMRKAGHLPGGFRWDDIWTALRGRLPDGRGESVRVTSDRMRARYEAALGKLAVAIGAVGA